MGKRRRWAPAKGVSLPPSTAVLHPSRNWARQKFPVPHGQAKAGVNHFAGCTLKGSAAKSEGCSGSQQAP